MTVVEVRGRRSPSKTGWSFGTRWQDCLCSCSPKDKNDSKKSKLNVRPFDDTYSFLGKFVTGFPALLNKSYRTNKCDS